MSELTKIQWADSTINPTMGCGGCELFPTPRTVTRNIDAAVAAVGATINSHTLLTDLIHENYAILNSPCAGHRDTVTSTNVWHLRDLLCGDIVGQHGTKAGHAALAAIRSSITCYAAKLHLMRGANILRPDRKANKGHAPSFEQVTNFGGRVAVAARWKDLLGTTNPETPWKDGLPRLTFISDMGDALSSKSERQFEFLEREVIAPVTSASGQRHLWLWLTKRPLHLRDFAERVGGLPANMCAMSTVTGPETLHRVGALRQVKAVCRGLSIEPLWSRIRPRDLALGGIDWIIVGGESGSGKLTRPFHLEWAEELHELCHRRGVAFFLKQLGRNPVAAGKPIRLRDPHGGDWSEWPKHLRVREFPILFHRYRTGEKVVPQQARPA
jgi:protein gp37